MDNVYHKFYVNFYDEDSDDTPIPEDEDGCLVPAFHGEIEINMTEREYDDWEDDNAADLYDIEMTYGTLDREGSDVDVGLASYEIERGDMAYVFETLCDMLSKYRTNGITTTETH